MALMKKTTGCPVNQNLGFVMKWITGVLAIGFFGFLSGFLTGCDRASYTQEPVSGLPGGLFTGRQFGDLNGGSPDTTVFCTDEQGQNLCTEGLNITPQDPSGVFQLPQPSQATFLQGLNGVACRTTVFNNTRRVGFRQNTKLNGIDLWLIVDASQPFDEVRMAVGQAILDGFLGNCELGVPLYISVILTHTPDSPDSSARGDVFYTHGTEPATVVLYPGMTEGAFLIARDNVLVKLQSEVRRDRPELHSGANEMGLLALSNALRRATNHQDRALVLVFASDENDVCMRNQNDTDDPDENAMFDQFCAPNNISPGSVYAQLRQFAGDRPLAVSAVIHGPQTQFPRGANKNPGRGYSDIVDLAGGQAVELLPSPGQTETEYIARMARDLTRVSATLTTRNVQFFPYYPLVDTNGLRLTLSSVRRIPDSPRLDINVYVDGQPVSYKVDPMYSLIVPDRSGQSVRIDYCLQ